MEDVFGMFSSWISSSDLGAVFASAFQDHFIPWSVREESRLRFESLRQDGLSVTEYEVHFFQLSRHALAIIPDETERIQIFVRGLTFSIISGQLCFRI